MTQLHAGERGKRTLKPITDGNSDFKLVELKSDWIGTKETPHCKNHGAMLSLTEKIPRLWRCIRATSLVTGKTHNDCRAGCEF